MDDLTKVVTSLQRMKPRIILQQFISFGLVVCTALMLWKALMVLTGCASPIVVVLSESMETGISKGDLLLLAHGDAPLEVGEIVVFNDGRDIPIIHRIIQVHQREDGETDLLTKGDNNEVNDRGLYKPKGSMWIQRKHVLGRAQAYLPHLGMLSIWMNDYPPFKWLLIGTLFAFVVVDRQ